MQQSQVGDMITIWYIARTNQLKYHTAPLISPSAGMVVRLPDNDPSMQLSTMLTTRAHDQDLLVNTLAYIDAGGAIYMLQCASDTGIWQPVPFYLPSDVENVEVPSFTLRFLAASDDPSQPVANCQLHIVSSGSVDTYCNGLPSTLTQDGVWCQADPFGVVTIVVPASDMGSFTFQVDMFLAHGQTAVPLSVPVLNPNWKLNESSHSYRTKLTFSTLRPRRASLFLPEPINLPDVQQAASMIIQLNKRQMDQGRPGQPMTKMSNKRKRYNPKGLRPVILAGRIGQGPEDTPEEIEAYLKKMSVASWYDIWSFFDWVYDQAKAATMWGLHTIGNSPLPLFQRNPC